MPKSNPIPKSTDEIRQEFLDFFKEKDHKIVDSASLLPEAPNLLFTNAGMNPFVPVFLGERPAEAPRIANSQRCLRAGGKHNDLDTVGLDSYHHTFFEMLGNWSFGDFFKKEAIEWAWELLTQKWKFPKERLYATIYDPAADPEAPRGIPFDAEAHAIWKALFEREGLDPAVHLIRSGSKDNFWTMGATGPCGPCSEIHMDLTPKGDSQGKLVNADSQRCIELWNLVFIQYNALENGNFEPLKTHYVDTGMGLERIAGIFAGTQNLTDFSEGADNYKAEPFLSFMWTLRSTWSTTDAPQKNYSGSYPKDPTNPTEQEKIDIAYRRMVDHLRAAVWAIHDGILPSNEGRGYVVRKIIRRALFALSHTLGKKSKDAVERALFPILEVINDKRRIVHKYITKERGSFLSVLEEIELIAKDMPANAELFRSIEEIRQLDDKGFFEELRERIPPPYPGNRHGELNFPLKSINNFFPRDFFIKNIPSRNFVAGAHGLSIEINTRLPEDCKAIREACAKENPDIEALAPVIQAIRDKLRPIQPIIRARTTYFWEDTHGVPLEFIEELAAEHGLKVDREGHEQLRQQQRERSRAAQKITKVRLGEAVGEAVQTEFCGFGPDGPESCGFGPDGLEAVRAHVLEYVELEDEKGGKLPYVLFEKTPFYAEAGGQLGDKGVARLKGTAKPEATKPAQSKHPKTPSALAPQAPLASKPMESKPSKTAAEPNKADSAEGIPPDPTGAIQTNSAEGIAPNFADPAEAIAPNSAEGIPPDPTEAIQTNSADPTEGIAPNSAEGESFAIINTVRDNKGNVLHELAKPANITKGQELLLWVDLKRRRGLARAHSATHLLNWALREHLGAHVRQRGSRVEPDKLRFDFSHHEALSKEQLRAIEAAVQQRIFENVSISAKEIDFTKKPEDAIATFGEKYGKRVRLVSIGGFAKELCGGTHAEATGQLGGFFILQSSAVAAGVRRLEACCGSEAARQFNAQRDLLETLAQHWSCEPAELLERQESLSQEKAALELLAKGQEARKRSEQAQSLAQKAELKDGLRWVSELLENTEPKALRASAVELSKTLGPSVVVLAAKAGDKVSIVALCSPEAIEKGQKAGAIISKLCGQLGGKGGGKPDFAMGGLPSTEGLAEALSGLRA